ncbi:AraC family transcriptional regulator [Paenibacillus beijingensis]|uniref:AraC family transcriptional regulator n=2 Tax=Paenibacillus beijingensis TaxID=1126833 RepID=A0A0D5NR48_9BACL|nr:AraC family transcriptional regulator [Paenibacillus beijingensis]
MNISIKELPDYDVAFVRHVGSYLDTYQAWGKLGAWAGKNNLFPPEQYFIGVSLDDPSITEEYACRYDACITIPQTFNQENESEVQFKTLPGGLYGLYQFYDTIDKFAITYQSLYGQWLPNSDYEPDERYCLEFCMNNPSDDPERKAKIELYIPIKKR